MVSRGISYSLVSMDSVLCFENAASSQNSFTLPLTEIFCAKGADGCLRNGWQLARWDFKVEHSIQIVTVILSSSKQVVIIQIRNGLLFFGRVAISSSYTFIPNNHSRTVTALISLISWHKHVRNCTASACCQHTIVNAVELCSILNYTCTGGIWI